MEGRERYYYMHQIPLVSKGYSECPTHRPPTQLNIIPERWGRRAPPSLILAGKPSLAKGPFCEGYHAQICPTRLTTQALEIGVYNVQIQSALLLTGKYMFF